MSDTIPTGLRLPVDLHEIVRRWAFDHHMSLNAVVVQAVREWIERQDKETAGGIQ